MYSSTGTLGCDLSICYQMKYCISIVEYFSFLNLCVATNCDAGYESSSRLIDSREKVVNDIQTKACKGTRNYVRYIEHTHVIVSLAHASRGAVSIYLTSPMGTRSRVLGRRKGDTKRGGFKSWAFLSTHFWGENPYGKWTLEIDSK